MTTQVRSDAMPKGIPFIISNEFAERFCFYGINSILVAYMIDFLHFGDAQAQSWQAMFKSAAYFFPLLGAIVSDVFLAKFRTIIWFSMVYVAGCATLALGSTPEMLVVGMFLVAFGTGGIKPCVSTNVGDQFTTANQHLIERAFSMFYFSINLGSSFSIYLCPELLADPEWGPKWAFGVPAIMMALATLVFWLGRTRFAVVPAAMEKAGFGPIIFIGVFLAMLGVAVGVRMVTGNYLFALFVMLGQLAGAAALGLHTGLRRYLPPELVQWLERSFTGDNLRTVLRLCVLYIFISLFWALWDQSNGNSWTVQAQSGLMDKRLFGFLDGAPAWALYGFVVVAIGALVACCFTLLRIVVGTTAAAVVSAIALVLALWFSWDGVPGLATYQMLPAQVQVVNGIFILLMIPVFTYVIYPFFGRFFEVTPLRKIGVGFFVCASSFLVVAWIEQRIQDGHVVSMWWQIAAYGVLTAAEVLVSITGLEYSYKQAPPVIKSFIMSLFLLSTSVGNALTATVNDLMIEPVAASAVSTGAETWVSLERAGEFIPGQKIDFGGANGIEVQLADGKTEPLAGTFLVAEVDAAGKRLKLMDKVARQPVASSGTYDAVAGEVSTYSLVGPIYFLFFAALMIAFALVYVFYAMRVKEQTHVRGEEVSDAEAASEVTGR